MKGSSIFSIRTDRIWNSERRTVSGYLGIVVLIGIISSIEFLLMLILPLFHLPRIWENTLDAGSLALLISPPIYQWFALTHNIQVKDSHLQLYKELFEQTLQGIMITDEKLNIIHVNAGFIRATGYSHDEAIGKTPKLLQSGRHGAEFYQEMWDIIRKTGQWEGEIWNRKKDGQIYAENLNISAIKGSTGQVNYYVGIFMDITHHKVIEQQLQDFNQTLVLMTNTDTLTKVANRRFFEHTLDSEWRRNQRNKTPLAVILLDIDCFKEYNDHYGHVAGDECLKAIAATIQSKLNGLGDVVARYGGEEFAVILPNTSISASETVAERLRCSVEQLHIPHVYCISGPYVTISLGSVACVPTSDLRPYELVEMADRALYEAKRMGKNQVVVHRDPG